MIFAGKGVAREVDNFMKDLKAGESEFKGNIANSHWISSFGMPEQIFNERKGYL